MRFIAILLGAAILQVLTVVPVLSTSNTFQKDVVAPVAAAAADSSASSNNNLRGNNNKRELVSALEQKEGRLDNLNEEIAELAEKVRLKRTECKPLNAATNQAKKLKKQAERGNNQNLKQRRRQQFNTARNKSHQCQSVLKPLVKQLRNKRARRQRVRKAIKGIKKRISNRRKKRRKSREDVTKDLVAGECVKDHKCAAIRGDPHITTFDGVKYDCQGEGEFVLAKTINSDSTFEVQARFKSIGKEKMVSITKAVSITTGTEGEPDVDIFTENVDGECALYYYVDGEPNDFTTPVEGISYEGNGDPESMDKSNYIFFTGSGIMYTVYAKKGLFGCVLNSKLCLPPSMVDEEDIVGLLGTPDGKDTNEWTTPTGAALPQTNLDKAHGYAMCTANWCVRNAEDSIFGYIDGTEWEDFFNCDQPYDANADAILLDPPDECVDCCQDHPDEELIDECIEECAMAEEGFGVDQCVIDMEDAVVLANVEKMCKDPVVPETEPEPTPAPTPPPVQTRTPPPPDTPSPEDKTTTKAFSKGDPHFKTFGGELYDYHGECDLVLLHNPDFKKGQGMDIHIRTKIDAFWSSIESAAIKLGNEIMEIKATNTQGGEWLWFNGKAVNSKEGEWIFTKLGGFLVRYKANGNGNGEAHLYLNGPKEQVLFKTYKSFVRIDVDWKDSDNYYNSVGLLGSHAHDGKRLGRDGQFIEDFNEFGQEWQVIPEVDGSLFHDYEGAVVGRKCVMPPEYNAGDSLNGSSVLQGRRLGASEVDVAAAEKACEHLVDPEEIKACVFDVISTGDVDMASTW